MNVINRLRLIALLASIIFNCQVSKKIPQDSNSSEHRFISIEGLWINTPETALTFNSGTMYHLIHIKSLEDNYFA